MPVVPRSDCFILTHLSSFQDITYKQNERGDCIMVSLQLVQTLYMKYGFY